MTRDEEVAAMDKDYDEMDFEEKSDYWEARSRRFEVANNEMRAGLDAERNIAAIIPELQYIQKAILMAQGLSAGAAGTAEELTQKVNEVWDVMRTPF